MNMSAKFILESFDLDVLSFSKEYEYMTARRELHLFLQFNQCERMHLVTSNVDWIYLSFILALSILNGTTSPNNKTFIANSATVGLTGSSDNLVNRTRDTSIIVVVAYSQQAISFHD